MDARHDERARQAVHAMVSAPTPRASRRVQTAPLAAIGKTVLLILVLISLVAAIAGGLVRAGLEWPGHPDSAVAGAPRSRMRP